MTATQYHELVRDFRGAYTELAMGGMLTQNHTYTRDWSDEETALKLGQVSRALSFLGIFCQNLVRYLGRAEQFEPDLGWFAVELQMGQLVSVQYRGSAQAMSYADLEVKVGQVSRALSYLVRVLERLLRVAPSPSAHREYHGVTRELQIAQSFSLGYRGSAVGMADRDIRRKLHHLSLSLWAVMRLLHDVVESLPHEGR